MAVVRRFRAKLYLTPGEIEVPPAVLHRAPAAGQRGLTAPFSRWTADGALPLGVCET
jgi:hypothetical protein